MYLYGAEEGDIGIDERMEESIHLATQMAELFGNDFGEENVQPLVPEVQMAADACLEAPHTPESDFVPPPPPPHPTPAFPRDPLLRCPLCTGYTRRGASRGLTAHLSWRHQGDSLSETACEVLRGLDRGVCCGEGCGALRQCFEILLEVQ